MRHALMLILLSFCASQASAAERLDRYWASLQALCGKAFEGELLQAPPGDTSFAGQRLLMHVRSCEPERIRIPFVVGDNLSRTWVLTRSATRITLKHDHRHPDGSDEPVTMYGGVSPNAGSAHSQIFPADDETVAVLPNGYPNVWMMSIEPGHRFVYFVQRQATDRAFRVDFDLSREVEAPPAPWGWSE